MQYKNSMDVEKIATSIVDAAITVHRNLGPGLLESAYQLCLFHELTKRGYQVEKEVVLPILYDGELIESGYRIDMRVNNCVLIENKTVDQLLPIHESQILTYMRLSNIHLGFLLNWKVKLMKDGIKRMIL
jgi:GxxExxY protein